MALQPGIVGHLYHVNIKINCDNRGYQMKFPLVNSDVNLARSGAEAICTAYKRCIPANAEIFYATLSNYSTGRDSRFLRNAVGPGKFVTAIGPPVVDSAFDTSWNGVKVRLENSVGRPVIRCINPVPDAVVTDELLQGTYTDVVAQYAGDDPADGDLTNFPAQLLSFFKILTKHSVYVQAGAIPGGAYTYDNWTAAYAIGVMKKKGSRAFV